MGAFTANLAEIWTLYALGTLMVCARTFVRVRTVGVRNFRPDDYLVWFAWAVYSEVTVIAHVFIIKAQGLHTSLLTPEQREAMPLSEYAAWEYGTQVFFVGLASYAVIVWTLKFNMLFFYQRVVNGLWVEKLILPAFGLVAASGVAIVLTLTLTCIPFHKLWQIWPDPGRLCVPQNEVTFYTILVLNLVTDVCIMLIPIPVVAPIRTGIWRRLGLYLLFSLGLFCMMAAILRVMLIFELGDTQGISAMWSIREDFVAIFVGQAPMVYPMLKKSFWTGHAISSHDDPTSDGHEMRTGVSGSGKPKDPYSLTQLGVTRIDPTESQENIIKETTAESSSSGDERSQKKSARASVTAAAGRKDERSGFADGHGKVRVDQTFRVETLESGYGDGGAQPVVVTPWHDSRGVNNGRAF
ncbi:hypothetical protein CC79DRAFT_1364753 [Sarocladium strictum]